MQARFTYELTQAWEIWDVRINNPEIIPDDILNGPENALKKWLMEHQHDLDVEFQSLHDSGNRFMTLSEVDDVTLD